MSKRNDSTIDVAMRFAILHRDGFACAFCGARPGNEHLQVDHVIPYSLGGSDDIENLVTLCDRCNNGKSASIVVPPRMTTGDRDADGWIVWKRWGAWSLVVAPIALALGAVVIAHASSPQYAYASLDRIFDEDWTEYWRETDWCTRSDLARWMDAQDFARRILDRRRFDRSSR